MIKADDTMAEEEMDSADEALCELLGITSLSVTKGEEELQDQKAGSSSSSGVDADHPSRQSLDDLLRLDPLWIQAQVDQHQAQQEYLQQSVCILPYSLHVLDTIMRRLTDELVWGGDHVQADKTYETIHVLKQGQVLERRTLTRMENFVNHHDGWKSLCCDYLRRCISSVMGEEMVLFKEKLNLKPAGGTGFAPHIDAPSLRVSLGKEGPQTFVTVMVAIDNATVKNGCLRIAKGTWDEDESCEVEQPAEDGNPDAGGRAGAIPLTVAESLVFYDLPCRGGSIVAFNGWAPHRSGPNQSSFARRAVFLTYNPASQGDFHDAYYEKMEALRNKWRANVGLTPPQREQLNIDDKKELDALYTVPRA
jgi:ectoine hydroxylase-related dioxygenase (phytanoyl-CoA dioxygenase family)